MNFLEHALDHAVRGLKVFPLQPNSKLPAIDDFVNRATSDPEQIERWWKDPVLGLIRPLNIGISTTRFNGNKALIGIDVDNKGKKKGSEELLRLELEGQPFPETATQITPSGGLHLIYFFDHAIKQGVNVLAPGIDIRSKGGYLVGSGSIIDGKQYTWKNSNAQVEPCPQWVVEKCGLAKEKESIEVDTSKINQDSAKRRAITYLENDAPLSIKGEGGDHTAYVVAAQLKDFGLPPQTCLELMLDHWNDRCPPGWTPERLKEKIDHAFTYGKEAVGAKAPETVFDKVELDVPPPQNRGVKIEGFHKIGWAASSNYVVKKLIDALSMIVIYGLSNSGKTFFALDLCLHIALGWPWNGRKVRQGAVVYVGLEGAGGLRKRIEAFRKEYKLTEDQAVPFGLISHPLDLRSSNADLNALVSQIKEFQAQTPHPIRLVVIDTLARAIAGGDENSSTDMGAFIRKVDQIRDMIGTAVLVVHHSGKDGRKGARGHSSLRAATDTEILIQGARHAVIEKQRDLEKDTRIVFRLKPIVIGQDEDGEVITSCVVKFDSTPSEDFDEMPALLRPGTAAYKAYEVLTEVGAVNGDKVVVDEWRRKFIEVHGKGSKKKSMYTAFTRARKELLDAGLTEEDGHFVRSPHEST